MTAYRIISSDSHVFEPADLWTTRIDKPFRERAPRVISDGQYDQWVVEDGKKVGSIGLVSQAGVRFEAPEKITFGGSYQHVRPGGWDPHEHVKDMEIDGVSGGVLYPSNGLFFFRIPDSRRRWEAALESTSPGARGLRADVYLARGLFRRG